MQYTASLSEFPSAITST